MSSNYKKNFIFIFSVAFFVFSVSASGRKDKLFNIIENESVKEVKSILRNNQDYVNITRGSEKQTLLMAALKEDREIEVINLLFRYGADPDKKDKFKRNAIMYAAQYSSSPEVLEKTIKADSFFGFTRKNRVLKKDLEGKNSFDYARKNPAQDKMLEVLKKFAQEPLAQEELDLTKESQSSAPQDFQDTPPAVESPPATASSVVAPVTVAPVAVAPVVAVTQESTEDSSDTVTDSAIPLTSDTDKNEEINANEDIKENSIQEDKPLLSAQNPIEPAIDSTPLVAVAPPVASAVTVEPFKRTYLFDFAEEESEDTIAPQESDFDSIHTFIENADRRDLNGRTKLMDAAKKGNLKLVENLIYSNANLNAKDNDGWTALMFAARFCPDVKIVRTLIKNGADQNLKNDYGITALKLASGFSRSPLVVSELLSIHNAAESDVRSSFIYAINSSAPNSTLDAFLKKGISLNNSYDGKTPLMYAAESNKDTRIINWLLKNGAKTTYRTSSGLTAFDFAKNNKNLPRDNFYWALSPYGEER